MKFSTRDIGRKGVSVILGPPGTGKTTTLMRQLASALDQGIPIEDIGFTSYTRAAIHEAKDRAQAKFGLNDEGFLRWGTTHSLAGRLLGQRGKQMWKPEDLAITARFAEKYYYPDLLQRRLPWDRSQTAMAYLLGEINFARCRLLDAEAEAQRAGKRIGVDGGKFYRSWGAFKHAESICDFTDLIEQAIELPPPRTRLLFVDEAQDLNPLQARFVERWIERADLTYVAGDDDQAIMGFQGGEAGWLQGLARSHPTRVLDQSYRIPASVHALAMTVAGRITDRVEKVFRPRPEEGTLEHAEMSSEVLDELIEQLEHGSVGYLCRLSADLVDVGKELLRLGIPYRCKDAADPLGPQNTKTLPAAQAVRRMATGYALTAVELDAILDAVKVKELGLRHGCKSAWQNATNRPSTLTEDSAPVDLRPLWRLARERGCGMLATGYGGYYDQVLSEDGQLPDKHVQLSTIHSSKGREWDSVYLHRALSLFDQQSLDRPRTRDADDVHRLAYVGATRARHSLTVLSPGVFGRHARGGKPISVYDYGRAA